LKNCLASLKNLQNIHSSWKMGTWNLPPLLSLHGVADEGFFSLILPFVLFLNDALNLSTKKMSLLPLRSWPRYYMFFFGHLQMVVWLKSCFISTTCTYSTTCYHSNSITNRYCALWMIRVFQETMIVCCCDSKLSVHTNQFVTNVVILKIQQNIIGYS
jgi:hypothetical protein